jgi:hypothetical protein
VRGRGRDKDKSERELLSDISAKLDRVAALIAIQSKEPAAQIRILSKLGVSSADIGTFLDRSAGTIRWSRTTRPKRVGRQRRKGT